MLIQDKNILLNTSYETKFELLDSISKHASNEGISKNKDNLLNAFLAREKLGSTGMVEGFAIPHAQTEDIVESSIIIVRNKVGIKDWETMDGNEVKLVFAILVPINGAKDKYLKILADLSRKLMNKELRNNIYNAQSEKEIMNLI